MIVPKSEVTVNSGQMAAMWREAGLRAPTGMNSMATQHYLACVFVHHFQAEVPLDKAIEMAWTNVGCEAMPCACCGKTFPSHHGMLFCSDHCWNKLKGQGCGEECDECENYGCIGAEDEEQAYIDYLDGMTAARFPIQQLMETIDNG